jgi:hypothetical protein
LRLASVFQRPRDLLPTGQLALDIDAAVDGRDGLLDGGGMEARSWIEGVARTLLRRLCRRNRGRPGGAIPEKEACL